MNGKCIHERKVMYIRHVYLLEVLCTKGMCTFARKDKACMHLKDRSCTLKDDPVHKAYVHLGDESLI